MTAVIVVPCYNEGVRWNAEYWAEATALPGVEWIFVDDGSTDDTRTLIGQVASAGAAAQLLLERNAGKAEAVRHGLLRALEGAPSAVGFMDADGAFDAQDVRDLLAMFEARTTPAGGFDAIWSSRVALAGRDIRRSARRHYIGRVVASFVSLGQEEIPYDTQSGLKLFVPSDTLAACLATPFETRWMFELEMLSRWQGTKGSEMRIWEEPLNYWHDVPGSKITVRESARILRELAVIKRAQRRARRS